MGCCKCILIPECRDGEVRVLECLHRVNSTSHRVKYSSDRERHHIHRVKYPATG